MLWTYKWTTADMSHMQDTDQVFYDMRTTVAALAEDWEHLELVDVTDHGVLYRCWNDNLPGSSYFWVCLHDEY